MRSNLATAVVITPLILLLVGLVGAGILFDRYTHIATGLEQCSSQLSPVSAQLSQVTRDLEKQKQVAAALRGQANEATRDAAAANGRAARMMCSKSLPPDVFESASTNEFLIFPINKQQEYLYGNISGNTTYDVLWNNADHAIFKIWNDRGETSQVVATWVEYPKQLAAVYDIGMGCFYYYR